MISHHDMRSIARAILYVDDAIRLRETTFPPYSDGGRPSREVLDRATLIVAHADELVSCDVLDARVYRIKGRTGDYLVALYVYEGTKLIIRGDCSCDAGRAKKTCSHLVAALALARLDGYRLEVE